MRRTLPILALLAVTVPADAAGVLCNRRTGAVVVRDACKPGESPLDAASLGFVGPPGPTGAAGATGPAGPAGSNGASSGITCITHCVEGDPSATFVCNGTTTTCPSPDGQQPVHGIFVDCTSAGILALPFCPASACAPGPCPSVLFDTGDAAKDARSAAAGQDAYFAQHDTYATACQPLPGFTSSRGATCTTAQRACASGYHGYTVLTVDRLLTICVWDSCPPDGVRLRCTPYPG